MFGVDNFWTVRSYTSQVYMQLRQFFQICDTDRPKQKPANICHLYGQQIARIGEHKIIW